MIFNKRSQKRHQLDKRKWLQEQMALNETRLIRYVIGLVKDVEVARDVVQEAYLKMWEEDQTTLKGHETQWLFKVCRNKAFDLLRHKKTRDVKLIEMREEVIEASTPEDAMIEKKQMGIMQKILQGLSPEHQEVLRLKFQQELSYKEISEITGMTVNHVGVLIHNIVTQLRESAQEKAQLGEKL